VLIRTLLNPENIQPHQMFSETGYRNFYDIPGYLIRMFGLIRAYYPLIMKKNQEGGVENIEFEFMVRTQSTPFKMTLEIDIDAIIQKCIHHTQCCYDETIQDIKVKVSHGDRIERICRLLIANDTNDNLDIIDNKINYLSYLHKATKIYLENKSIPQPKLDIIKSFLFYLWLLILLHIIRYRFSLLQQQRLRRTSQQPQQLKRKKQQQQLKRKRQQQQQLKRKRQQQQPQQKQETREPQLKKNKKGQQQDIV
jgi:hypothetical protein